MLAQDMNVIHTCHHTGRLMASLVSDRIQRVTTAAFISHYRVVSRVVDQLTAYPACSACLPPRKQPP